MTKALLCTGCALTVVLNLILFTWAVGIGGLLGVVVALDVALFLTGVSIGRAAKNSSRSG